MWHWIFYHFTTVVCGVSQLHCTWITQMVKNVPFKKITNLNFTILITRIPCKQDTYKFLVIDLGNSSAKLEWYNDLPSCNKVQTASLGHWYILLVPWSKIHTPLNFPTVANWVDANSD
jgi:hypothetical protein